MLREFYSVKIWLPYFQGPFSAKTLKKHIGEKPIPPEGGVMALVKPTGEEHIYFVVEKSSESALIFLL